jgi:hypothetical protein
MKKDAATGLASQRRMQAFTTLCRHWSMNILSGRHAASTAPGCDLKAVNHLDHGYDPKTAVHRKSQAPEISR